MAMSSRAAASDAASAPRVLPIDDGRAHDVFDVISLVDDLVRARSPYLFEVGEQLSVRIEQDGAVSEAQARVRAHVGPDDAKITELELSEQTSPRAVVAG
jgi:hypothetical protein